MASTHSASVRVGGGLGFRPRAQVSPLDPRLIASPTHLTGGSRVLPNSPRPKKLAVAVVPVCEGEGLHQLWERAPSLNPPPLVGGLFICSSQPPSPLRPKESDQEMDGGRSSPHPRGVGFFLLFRGLPNSEQETGRSPKASPARCGLVSGARGSSRPRPFPSPPGVIPPHFRGGA